MTVGVKFRMMPNFFQLTDVLPRPLEIGMGNSPPARNLASWPDSATRVGSARIFARPLDSSRLTIADRGNLGMPEKNSEKAEGLSGENTGGTPKRPVPGRARVAAGELLGPTPPPMNRPSAS